MYKPVNKSVQVTVYFHSKIEILKFIFKNKVYNVSEMVSSWQEEKGKNLFSQFTVKCKKQNIICELQVCHKDLKWILIHWDTLN